MKDQKKEDLKVFEKAVYGDSGIKVKELFPAMERLLNSAFRHFNYFFTAQSGNDYKKVNYFGLGSKSDLQVLIVNSLFKLKPSDKSSSQKLMCVASKLEDIDDIFVASITGGKMEISTSLKPELQIAFLKSYLTSLEGGFVSIEKGLEHM